jgi:hypothetical protein
MKTILKVIATAILGIYAGYVLVVIGITLISLILFCGASHTLAISFDTGLAFMKLFFVLAVFGWVLSGAIKAIVFFWR